MENPASFINNLLGKIYLTKTAFFGLDKSQIVVLVTPSMKIAAIGAKPNRLRKKFPFKEGQILNAESLKEWAQVNDFEITFSAVVPKVKKMLFYKFGDVMAESLEEFKESDRTTTSIVLEELEKSDLPQNIKNWAKENPEKFIQNLEEVKKLLGLRKRKGGI